MKKYPKKYEFDIDKAYLDRFFSPVRDKVKIIELLMESIRYMTLNPSVSEENKAGKIIIQIEKMSRLFFFTKEKSFSIAFPFFISNENNEYRFIFKNLVEVNGELISQIISSITCDKFDSHCSLDFIEPISDFEESNDTFWIFLKELFLMETGYIRYDYDPQNYEKFKSEGNEHQHPLHHCDIFYSSNSTFKLGLKKSLLESEFIDLLNINTNCKYLT